MSDKLPYEFDFLEVGEEVWIEASFEPGDNREPVTVTAINYEKQMFTADDVEEMDFEYAFPSQYSSVEEYHVEKEIRRLGSGLEVSDFLSEEEKVLELGERVYRIYNGYEGL